MIDIVIPTLMLIDSCPIKYSLQEACKSNLINQIIIIDNSGGLFEENISINSEKIQVLTMPENIYVNPAWNLGVSKCCSENIVIMNDDVFCNSEVYMQIETVMKEENVEYELSRDGEYRFFCCEECYRNYLDGDGFLDE